MGVYTARNTQDSSGGGEGQASKKTVVQDYIHAVLEEDKTIEHGSSVIFILSKPAVIDGVRHNPGSTLYGKAALASEMFDIQVYQIKSTNGNMYRCSLTAYDENYNQGIRTGGDVNKAARESADDAAIEQMDVYTNNKLLNSAVKAAVKTASQSKNRKVTVSLRKGYKIHLMQNDTR